MKTSHTAALAAALAAAAMLASAHAQDRPPARATQETQLTLGRMIKNGGWTMWPLGFCSVAFVGLTLFNAFYIREKRLAPTAAALELEKNFGRLDFEAARKLCASVRSPLTNIVAAGLERTRGGRINPEEIQGGMEGAAPEQVAKNQTTINYLSVVGVIAPMLGLLGTVSGMIQAFQSMSLQGMGRPELFAGNISEALITTGAGLVIGIPAMVSYYIFKYRFNGIMAAISRRCGNIMSSLRHSLQVYAETGALPPEEDQAA
jgi:biopolymer transport protein ExbB